jgi:hypothetical protein
VPGRAKAYKRGSPPQEAGPELCAQCSAHSDREPVPNCYRGQGIIQARERASHSAPAAGDKAGNCPRICASRWCSDAQCQHDGRERSDCKKRYGEKACHPSFSDDHIAPCRPMGRHERCRSDCRHCNERKGNEHENAAFVRARTSQSEQEYRGRGDYTRREQQLCD